MSKDTYGNPNTPVTGTDIDTDYGGAVVDRVVRVFPTTTARDAAITSPDEGQMVVISGDPRIEVYDGSSWVPVRDYAIGVAEYDSVTETWTTTSTTYEDLDDANGSGDVTVTVDTQEKALVLISCTLSNSSAGSTTYLAYRISGDTTSSASSRNSLQYESGGASDRLRAGIAGFHAGLTPGENTFTLQAKVSSGTGSIYLAQIIVVPLP